jgi:hypothetical protein
MKREQSAVEMFHNPALIGSHIKCADVGAFRGVA